MHPDRRTPTIIARLGALVGAPTLALLVATGLWIGLATTTRAQDPNHPPVVGRADLLYDAALGNLPGNQQFFFLSSRGSATQSYSDGAAVLDTTADRLDQAGYTHVSPPQSPPDRGGGGARPAYFAPRVEGIEGGLAYFPPRVEGIEGGLTYFPPRLGGIKGGRMQSLDRTHGYTLRFNAQVVTETHVSADRAGFSVIAISDDLLGIELGFWTDQIWAQDGGSGTALFTHAEGAAYDTTRGLVPYELTVLGDTYVLAVTNTVILSGPLRDYRPFSGFPDPYETPNLIFFGDDTRSAQARVRLGDIAVITDDPLPDRSVAADAALRIQDLGVLDIDAAGKDLLFSLEAAHGTLTVTASLPGGIPEGQIAGNGGGTVILTGTAGALNTTLVDAGGLAYRSAPAFDGTDLLTITLDDRGHSGSGGPLTDSQTVRIEVIGGEAYATYFPVVIKP